MMSMKQRVAYSLGLLGASEEDLDNAYEEIMDLDNYGPPVKCESCQTVIQSMYRHNMVWCPCREVAIDGGSDYTKLSYMPGAKYTFDF